MSGEPSPDPHPEIDDRVADVWREHRRLLLDVAYRMLGSINDAEDAVQEAFARLIRVDLDGIDDVRGWLVVVVTRLCLDQLRSARVRHEAYVGPWLPEPLIELPGQEPDPADRVTLDDSVRMALLVVLERLSPAERAAFVLHDVFGFSFDATPVADDPRGGRTFAFAVPLSQSSAAQLGSLRLAGPGGAAEALSRPVAAFGAPAASDSVVARRVGRGVALHWNATAHPMVMVRDARSGEILSFARGGDATVAAGSSELEVVVSDRVRSRRVEVKVP